MHFSLYLKGILIGLAAAAPIGPINIIVVQRTLTKGRKIGWVSGVGAAAADAIYGAIPAFGLTLLSGFLINNVRWFELAGGIVLMLFGLFIALRNAQTNEPDVSAGKHASAFASLFFLNFMSPVTILSYAALFVGLSFLNFSYGFGIGPVVVVLGIFSGSVLWVTFLVLCAHLLRRFLHERWLKWINVVTGAIIIVFGLLSLAKAMSGG